MIKAILVVTYLSSYNGQPVSIIHDFDNMQTCQYAESAIFDQLESVNNDKTFKPYIYIKTKCVKGYTNE